MIFHFKNIALLIVLFMFFCLSSCKTTSNEPQGDDMKDSSEGPVTSPDLPPVPVPETSPRFVEETAIFVSDAQKELMKETYQKVFAPRSNLGDAEADFKNYMARLEGKIGGCSSLTSFAFEKERQGCVDTSVASLDQIKAHLGAVEEEWQRVKGKLMAIGAEARLPDHEAYIEAFRSRVNNSLHALQELADWLQSNSSPQDVREWKARFSRADEGLKSWQRHEVISVTESRPKPITQ